MNEDYIVKSEIELPRIDENIETPHIEEQLMLGNMGSSGTDDYEELSNKPQINSVELVGNKTLNELGITDAINAHHDSTKYDATNPSGFQTSLQVQSAISSYHDNTKYDASNPDGYQTATQVANAVAAHHDNTKYDATNPSGFVNNLVDDLVNYYLKTDTYSADEIDQIISTVKQFRYLPVVTLPTASASTMGIIYLVPSADPQTQNTKDEYITIESEGSYSWEQIGSTAIDLTGYATEDYVDEAVATKYTKPSSGIPASDLAEGVIPTVPTRTSDLINDSGFAQVVDFNVSVPTTWTYDETANWYIKVVNVTGILATDKPFVEVNLASATTSEDVTAILDAWANVFRISTAAGSITLYSGQDPEVSIPLMLRCIR